MNIKDLKWFISELILGGLLIVLLITGYLAGMAFMDTSQQQDMLTQLQKQVLSTQRQVSQYSQVTEEDKAQWKKISDTFMDSYPLASALPKQITYDAINRSFQGVDIPIEAVSLYEMLYGITRLTGIQNIDIIEGEINNAYQNEKINQFLNIQQLDIYFSAQYGTVFRFIKELRQLPLVLEVAKMRLSQKDGLVKTHLTVYYMNRKEKNPFPQYN
ncbi:MAG: hypothetical protein HQM11_01210 [SAR324 cluster bacterium]|nr:hypothetical protein [SAR324 cluster bacterium]